MRTGGGQLGQDAHEHGHGVGGQVLARQLVQPGEVDVLGRAAGHDGRAARPAVLAGDLHAVHGDLGHARRVADDLGDLGGGHVLALPAERVAHAVDEIVVPERVAHEQVARAEEAVALAKHVAQQLLFRLLLVAQVAWRAEALARLLDNAKRAPSNEPLARPFISPTASPASPGAHSMQRPCLSRTMSPVAGS